MVTSARFVTEYSRVGWNCGAVVGIVFYLIWIIGIGLIIFGFFQKKKAVSA